MITAPPAIIIVPLASKEQVYQTVGYLVNRLKQLGVSIRHIHREDPVYIPCRTTKEGLLERVDVYLATAGGDFANVLPTREEIREGFVEKAGYVHLVQGVAVLFSYEAADEPRLKEVVIYTVGGPYKDFKVNL
ncbi:MAG: hypothetical protein ABWK05_09225 [Pyrobaculum sp.]